MRSRSVAVAVLLSVAFAGGAVASFLQAHTLRTEARWLMERGSAQAQEYAQTFDGAFADSQLDTFAQRREVLDRAQLWQTLQWVLVLASVIAAFSSYVLWLLKRLNDQLLGPGDSTGATYLAPAASTKDAKNDHPLVAV